jgi:hypothetical protein
MFLLWIRGSEIVEDFSFSFINSEVETMGTLEEHRPCVTPEAGASLGEEKNPG